MRRKPLPRISNKFLKETTPSYFTLYQIKQSHPITLYYPPNSKQIIYIPSTLTVYHQNTIMSTKHCVHFKKTFVHLCFSSNILCSFFKYPLFIDTFQQIFQNFFYNLNVVSTSSLTSEILST